MHTPSMGGAVPSAIEQAPDRRLTPLPASFGLTVDPSTATFDAGSVLMGGAPLRLMRLSPRAQRVVERWRDGALVGDQGPGQRLARRLVSGGTFVPRPTQASFTASDVTVVIPVRNRPRQLERLLIALDGLACVVVDDASYDQRRSREVAAQHQARYIGHPANAGPSVARNAGLAVVTTPLVAFVDSDCLPGRGWLNSLLGYFDDPLVAAVAPRIIPARRVAPSWLASYEAVRSSLDRGPKEGLVRPQSPIPYVPSAALLVRRSVAGQHLFDPRLRGGEDVDLVWRLVAAGWDVRYVPAGTVEHEGPDTTAAFLSRRAFYGSSAAPLAHRHPQVMAPLHASVWTASVWALCAARRPVPAAVVLAASMAVLARRLRGLVDDPMMVAATIAGGGTVRATLPALSGLTRAWSPALVLALLHRRTRRTALMALLVPALADRRASPGQLDPVRYAALHMADDVAYGVGVWFGCLQARTVRPLLPRVTWRARVWSTNSLRTNLAGRVAPTPSA